MIQSHSCYRYTSGEWLKVQWTHGVREEWCTPGLQLVEENSRIGGASQENRLSANLCKTGSLTAVDSRLQHGIPLLPHAAQQPGASPRLVNAESLCPALPSGSSLEGILASDSAASYCSGVLMFSSE